MTRYPPRTWLAAAALSALAGAVDAIGFMTVGGLFVSFMSGNTTRLAVGIARGSEVVALAGALIAAFVASGAAGFWIGPRLRRRAGGLLSAVALLLVAAALIAPAHPAVAALFMAAAMGIENAVFERDGEVAIGLTYMTGALVRLAQKLAAALSGGPRWDWVPFLLLWAGLAAGAIGGALLFAAIGVAALWVAAALAAMAATVAFAVAPA